MRHYSRYGSRQTSKQSGLGIASFVLSLIAIASGALVIGAAAFYTLTNRPEPPWLDSLAGSGALLGAGLGLIGLILGIAGLFAHGRRKLFAVLGVVFSCVFLLAAAAIVAIGTAAP